ncbi:MAG: hypothetical protein ABW167_07770 [Baekduia sp.]
MTTAAQGYQLIADLLRAGKDDAAHVLAEALQWRAENEPRLKALEFELGFMLDQIRDGQEVGGCQFMTVDQRRQEGDEDADDALIRTRDIERITHFVKTSSFDQSERRYVVVTPSQRLAKLLEGDLPALRAFVEGRTP